MTTLALIICILLLLMKTLNPINGAGGNQKVLVNKINQLIAQNNEQKEEIRQIKQKLRVNGHFSRRN